MNFSKEETKYFLQSSASKALLGEIAPHFRAIAVQWEGITAHLYFYIDGEISVQMHDDCISIGTEIVASFSKAKIDEHIIRLDYPQPLPSHKHWVYKRKETAFEHEENAYADVEQSIYLIALKAALGRIPFQVRGIYVDASKEMIKLIFYIDGELQKECIEDFEKILERFVRHAKRDAAYEVQQWDAPEKLPLLDPWYGWIYQRKEQEN